MARMRKRITAAKRPTDQTLSQEVLGLLRLHASIPNRLCSRENTRLEFKKTFNWGSRAKYAKTMASFANNDGGFIVFGVKNSPHDLVGVKTERFDVLDPEKVTDYLNSAFAPALEWAAFRVEVGGLQLGVLAVPPTGNRPVVCTKTDGTDLRAADIYFRYRGRSERIRYAELQRLLQERQEDERNAWLEHLAQVATIGVKNVGVLDLVEGEFSGPGGSLLVSEELLRKVQFIREGHFTESSASGLPTLRLVGDVKAVSPRSLGPVRTVAKPMVIGEKEILLGFLRQESLLEPRQYVKQACRESSKYTPVYYFAHAANLSLGELRQFVSSESSRSKGLVERVKGALVAPVGSLTSNSDASEERNQVLRLLEKTKLDETGLRAVPRMRLFEALTHYEPAAPPTELFGLLASIVDNEFGKLSSNQRTQFRKAVAHLDEVLNRRALVERQGSGAA